MPHNEVTMARAAVRVGVPLALVVTGLAWAIRGPAGGLTALGAVALVVGNFTLTGHSLGWAARFGPTAIQAVALGGFLVRLVAYAVLIVVLRPVEAIDGPVLAISTAAAMVVVLAYEVRLVLRHTELWWLHDRKERP